MRPYFTHSLLQACNQALNRSSGLDAVAYREPPLALHHEQGVPAERVLPVAVREPRLSQIVEDTFDDLACVHTLRVASRFDGELLDGEDIHFILNLQAKDVACVSLEGFPSDKQWEVVGGPIDIVAGHVDNAAFVGAAGLHLRAQESRHHHHWESVDVGSLDELRI